MTTKPILFSGPMVRAIQDGRKTQTRRVLKLKPGQYLSTDDTGQIVGGKLPCAPGDMLWVRETWKTHSTFAHLPPSAVPLSKVFYGADNAYAPSNVPWRPSIHMPRWASRLTLEIEAVKVERLQDISGENAKAEGIVVPECGCEVCATTSALCPADQSAYIMEFATLWNARHGPGAWDANPWVCAITFKPVDALPAKLREAS